MPPHTYKSSKAGSQERMKSPIDCKIMTAIKLFFFYFLLHVKKNWNGGMTVDSFRVVSNAIKIHEDVYCFLMQGNFMDPLLLWWKIFFFQPLKKSFSTNVCILSQTLSSCSSSD